MVEFLKSNNEYIVLYIWIKDAIIDQPDSRFSQFPFDQRAEYWSLNWFFQFKHIKLHKCIDQKECVDAFFSVHYKKHIFILLYINWDDFVIPLFSAGLTLYERTCSTVFLSSDEKITGNQQVRPGKKKIGNQDQLRKT